MVWPQSSGPEEKLAGFLDDQGIEYLWGSPQIPSFLHPITMRQHRPDFYIPSAKVFIEVKGLMTLYEITKMDGLTHKWGNYYVYQVSDQAWNPCLSDWPPNHMPAKLAKTIKAAANAATEQYLRSHPERRTTSWSPRKAHKILYQTELQRRELIAICENPRVAAGANIVTKARLRGYVINQLESQGWLTSDVVGKLRELATGP